MNMRDILLARALGGGSGGGVTSWNDLTDKPFGEETGVVEILPETNLTPVDGGFITEFDGEILSGETYEVRYNGTNYNVVAADLNGIAILGNQAGLGNYDVENTGEPFAIVIVPMQKLLQLIPLDGAQEVTLAISGYGTEVRKLDAKFYNSPCVYYISTSSGGSEYFYSDITRENKVTSKEFMKTAGRPIVLRDEYLRQYYPICVGYDAYGYSNICIAIQKDESVTTIYRYTAEYEA